MSIESDVDDLSVVSLETVDEIGNEEASRLLTTYADLKMKEAENATGYGSSDQGG